MDILSFTEIPKSRRVIASNRRVCRRKRMEIIIKDTTVNRMLNNNMVLMRIEM